ncbi:sortase [Fictibacillus sp. 7GRE50]|uniref:class F sortase n=1 Tax=Fictibacillus sp. 7GRE50 TaxID=2745878 RepID=UPI0018CE08E2|nr:class F sortase [Fictibacillus sp. 7GRE50]MBH0164925.1 sortase [Fictibacillus sp. 7GRE50]
MKKIIFLSISSLLCFVLAAYSYGIFPSQASSLQEKSKGERIESNLENATQTPDTTKSPLAKEFTLLKSEVKKLTEAQARESAEMRGIVPVRIEIPAINVKAPIEQVGILENGQMGVPEDTNSVGWFEPGAKPGGRGSSVLAGHVDSKTGPAIFFDLKKLKQGDEIIITDKNGAALTFVVNKQKSYQRNSAPINEIFQTTSGQNLNLITCSGVFDRTEGTHEERLVVFAELKKENVEKPVTPPEAPENVEVNGSFVTWHAVRKDNIVGYRIYRSEQKDGKFEQVGSISAHERKNFTDENAESYYYYVTSIDTLGKESKPSSITKVK